MRKIFPIAASLLLMVSLTSCGYSGFYRNPCQDPANWEAKECNPPICEASQTCTKDVINITPDTAEQDTANG